jgi:hypothetical protein
MIVGRRRSVWADANDLAEVIGKVLRLIARHEMFTQRDKKIIVRRLRDPAAKMIGR